MENNTDIKSGIKAYVDMVKSYLMDSEKFFTLMESFVVFSVELFKISVSEAFDLF